MPTTTATIRARALRQANFTAEKALWNALKSRQLGGHKFTRQFPIGPYFADFTCRAAMLVVELDGSQHQDQLSHDRARDEYMIRCGYSVLRLQSVSTLTNRDGLCDAILAAIEGRLGETISTADMRFLMGKTVRLRRGQNSRSAVKSAANS